LGSRPESSQEHLPTNIAGVLRLRAIKLSVYDRAAKRFAQDDGFVGGLKCNWLNIVEKVTGSQDDVLLGVLKRNVPNKMGFTTHF
jgi:hypothetical protein